MNDNFKNILKLFLLIVLVITNLEANKKAEVKTYDFTNENVLHDAVRAHDFEMVKYLVNQGVNIDKQDEYGYSPLHLAVRLHQYNISSYLIDNKAVVNTIDSYDDTPLIDATRNNDTNISKLLICHGANRNVVDAYGMTTLQNSAKNKNQEVVNLLRVDNLKPYCQEELKISMHPFEVSHNNAYSKKICGDIIKGFVVDLQVEFKDEDDEVFGPFKAEFSNETKNWCIDTDTTTLEDDMYQVKAIAKDYVVNEASDSNLGYVYSQKLDIIFDDVNSTTYPYPRICGTTNSDAIDIVEVSLTDKNNNMYGIYPAIIDDKAKRWCADVSDKLEHGYYKISLNAFDLYDQYLLATKENYFVNTAQFEIVIDDVKEINNLPREVCGTTNKNNLINVNIEFTDENMISYKLPKAQINDINQTWCSVITEIPPKGIYTIKATGTTTKKEIATDTYESYNLGNLINNNDPKISINDYNETIGNKPQICGKILDGNVVKGKITIKNANDIEQGTYKIKIDAENKTWCSKVTDTLKNEVYSVTANVYNGKKTHATATTNFEVYVIPELYESLMKEFQNDMQSWNANLDRNSLVFSFRDPKALFKRGSTELNDRFKNILLDFFPRYVKVTHEYKQHIQNIIIEGHSSSENGMGKTKEEKFKLNKIVSIKRADNVLSYTNKIVSKNIGNNILWVIDTFESNGLSSSNLIYNTNGTENREMSRRVEFRIKNIRSSLIKKGK